jgi:hypothetical protein
VYNRSKKVKIVELDSKVEVYNWTEKHKAPIVSKKVDITGYNRITHEIIIKLGNYRFYVIERFDGVKVTVNDSMLYWAVVNKVMRRNDGKIVNAHLQHTYSSDYTSSEYVLISDTGEISKRSYIPNMINIREYIANYGNDQFGSAAFDGNVTIVKLKMTKEEFENLIPKLRLLGFPTMLVDLNTVATVQDNTLKLYSRQRAIEG